MSNKEFQIPTSLQAVYEQRSMFWNVKSTKDLEMLLETSEREFYYYLTYAYIHRLDLTGILSQDSLCIRLSVSVYYQWVKDFGYVDICKYLDKFMVANESTEQAYRVIHEIKMMTYKESLLNDGQLLD
ncbi:MAG: hypothetical protein IJE43_19435 [Alphaproteobacteria bacterium]|nr:hypothetical protein [Alphaproteobacteria bacterium]